MAENKKLNWLTTEQKAPKPTQERQGNVIEKQIDSERRSERNIEKFKQGGKIFESQGPSRKKSQQEANECYSEGPCKPHK